MTTHMPFDPYINEETVAEVREHWKGPFHFGAPDGIVVNVTPDDIWVREGILPDYPNSRAPQFDFDDGQLVVPHRPPAVRKSRSPLSGKTDRSLGVLPRRLPPRTLGGVAGDGDLVVPMDQMPPQMLQGMGQSWRTATYKKHISELTDQ